MATVTVAYLAVKTKKADPNLTDVNNIRIGSVSFNSADRLKKIIGNGKTSAILIQNRITSIDGAPQVDNVYLCDESGVPGIELAPGQMTPLLPISNLDKLYVTAKFSNPD
jgi:hypothetical protein